MFPWEMSWQLPAVSRDVDEESSPHRKKLIFMILARPEKIECLLFSFHNHWPSQLFKIIWKLSHFVHAITSSHWKKPRSNTGLSDVKARKVWIITNASSEKQSKLKLTISVREESMPVSIPIHWQKSGVETIGNKNTNANPYGYSCFSLTDLYEIYEESSATTVLIETVWKSSVIDAVCWPALMFLMYASASNIDKTMRTEILNLYVSLLWRNLPF